MLLLGRGLLGPLDAVLRTALRTAVDTAGVKSAADYMISDAGEILYPASPDEYDRMLLEIMSLPGNVRGHFETVYEPYSERPYG